MKYNFVYYVYYVYFAVKDLYLSCPAKKFIFISLIFMIYNILPVSHIWALTFILLSICSSFEQYSNAIVGVDNFGNVPFVYLLICDILSYCGWMISYNYLEIIDVFPTFASPTTKTN